MQHTGSILAVSMALAILCPPQTLGASDRYAVVVSQETAAAPDWKPVAEALIKKHDGQLLTWKDDPAEILPALTEYFPKYVCFVLQPAEAPRPRVMAIHGLMRQLDDDPYTDAIWGILTGYTAGDALRIAQYEKPLIVQKALSATVGATLDHYEEGILFDELKKETVWTKKPGEAPVKGTCPQDTTRLIVEAMNAGPDVLITSGHATEQDWMPGYGYRNGRFICRNGQVIGLDLEGGEHVVQSPNPKIHLAIGNCLIAHVNRTDCMALSLMRSAGVYQMVGYVVSSGYGFGGWGVKDYFSEHQAGRFSLSEAHYVNNLALLYHLIQQGEADKPWNRSSSGSLLGDRDTVVLHGDPAWEARMIQRELPWQQTLTENDGLYTFRITGMDKGDWDNRPIAHLLPHRIQNIQIIAGAEYKPVVTDNFILVPLYDKLTPMKGNRGEQFEIQGDYEKGQVFEIRFKATRIEP